MRIHNRLNRSLTLFYVLLILFCSRTTLSAEPQDTYLIYHDIIRGLGRAEEANVRLKQIPVASEVGQTAFSLQMMTALTVARNLLREAQWFTMDNVTNLTSDPPGRTDPRSVAQQYAQIHQTLENQMQRGQNLFKKMAVPDPNMSRRQLQELMQEVVEHGAAMEGAWELYFMLAQMASLSLHDFDRCSPDPNEECHYLKITASERQELIRVLEAEFGVAIRQGGVGMSHTKGSAALLWMFLNKDDFQFASERRN